MVSLLGGAGAAAVFVYSLATDAPPAFVLISPVDLGPTDEAAGRLDPNAGLRTTPLEPLQPVELASLSDEQIVGRIPAQVEDSEVWLFSERFGDGAAAEMLARALLAKGAPNDRVALVRSDGGAGTADWHVEIGPVTANQAIELQQLLRREGLSFVFDQ
ncbi:hypothetical protein [Achromobacter sp. DH1f]|uniref:hypothetical protein n=1 Tax=Achromobacter sp. DH1f TaxID=1397275 RepID=UPI001E4421F9|nr:hypothetical protein [Achromobacter sp. DH1f]